MKNLLIYPAIWLMLISCEKEVSVSPQLEQTYKNYKIVIDSEPKGADIYINGRYYGKKTPDTINYIQIGQTDIKLKLKYWKDYNEIVNGLESEIKKTTLNFYDLPDVKGEIKFKKNGIKADSIFINEKFIGLSPRIEYLFPGKYSVLFSKEKHLSENYNVEIYSNKSINLDVNLIDTSFIVPLNKIDEKNNSVSYLLYDKKFNNLITSSNFGIMKLSSGGKLIDFLSNIDLKNEYIKNTCEEDDKTILLTQRNILLYKNEKFSVYDNMREIIKADALFSITKDNNNNYWIGTNAGLWKYTNGTITNFNRSNSIIPNNYIYNVVCMDNVVYFSSENILFAIDKNNSIKIEKKFTESYVDMENRYRPTITVKRDIKKMFVYNNVLTISGYEFKDITGKVLMGSELLYIFKDGVLLPKNILNIIDSKINNVRIDTKGNYWILTSEGIKTYDSLWNIVNIIPEHMKGKLSGYYILDVVFVNSQTAYLITSKHGLIKVKI